MTRFTFSDYTARLREFIRDSSARISAKQFSSSAEFNDLAMRLFKLQFAFNQPYRQFCELRGVLPDQIIHWKQLPAIPASAFKELDLTSLAPGERTTVFHSSGSTERKPSRLYHDAGSLSVYESSLLPWFEAHFGLAEPSSPRRMMILTPTPEQAPHSSLVHMFDTVRREFGDPQSLFTGQVDASGAWVLDVAQNQAELARAVGTNQPLAVLGTAFNFVHLLDHLAQGRVRFQLPSGSCALETGGYKGRSRVLAKGALHELIIDHLGIPAERIVCEYGMSELSSQAYDLELNSAKVEIKIDERIFRFPPWARAQLISPETGREVREGETGLIRVIDLANVRSVLALQTKDLGIRRGAGFELLGRASLAEPRGCSLMVA